MRLVLDARKYSDFGIGTYIRNLLNHLSRRPGVDLLCIVSPLEARQIQSTLSTGVIINTSAKYSPAELITVALQANRARADVFHAPHYTLPFLLNPRTIVTIHDLIHLRFPEYYSFAHRMYARFMLEHACRAADAVIVDSHFVRDELVDIFPAVESKIAVVHLGVDEDFRRIPKEETLERFRSRLALPEEVLLYVGNVKPHKNIRTLLEALARVPDVHLMVVGGRLDLDPELAVHVRRPELDGRIHQLGRVSPDELVCAYHIARALVLPSLYEGFGLPLVEAMACGTPVVASRSTAIPEVLGDAGELVDPRSIDDLSGAIHRIVSDSSLRQELQQRGLERSKQFSWHACAEKTISVYGSDT